jgi:hypothetical protein
MNSAEVFRGRVSCTTGALVYSYLCLGYGLAQWRVRFCRHIRYACRHGARRCQGDPANPVFASCLGAKRGFET